MPEDMTEATGQVPETGLAETEALRRAIGRSPLSEAEKAEFVSLMPRIPKKTAAEIEGVLEIDAREALNGARFAVEMETVTSKLDAFDEKVRSLAGTVVKAGKKIEATGAEEEKRAAAAFADEIL